MTERTNNVPTERILAALWTALLIACACMLAAASGLQQAWAAADPGVYTATTSASYTNPDDGSIADAGGSTNQTLGQSMVEGLVQPEAFVENDGEQETVTVRFGQNGMISDVRVAADIDHDGTFDAEATCEKVQESEDGKTADYRFVAADDSATFKFSIYVEPMGRDVNFFLTLGDLVEGNQAGFVQTVTEDQIQANTAKAEQSASAASASASSASASATSASSDTSASAASASAAASDAASASDSSASAAAADSGASASESSDGGLNMPLIIGIVIAAVVVLALVAYFAAIRPGKTASKEAAERAARKEKYKNQ